MSYLRHRLKCVRPGRINLQGSIKHLRNPQVLLNCNNYMKVWEPFTNKEKFFYPCERNDRTLILPDGLSALHDEENKVTLIDLIAETQREILSSPRRVSLFAGICSRYIAVNFVNSHLVHLVDILRNQVKPLNYFLSPHSLHVYEDYVITTSSDNRLFIVNYKTNSLKQTSLKGTPTLVTQDGKYLFMKFEDGSMTKIEIPSCIQMNISLLSERTTSLAVMTNGNIVYGHPDGSITVTDLIGTVLYSFKAHANRVVSLVPLYNNHLLSGDDFSLKVWELK